jgi:hypothetical protein
VVSRRAVTTAAEMETATARTAAAASDRAERHQL